jgi:hypothetical protein
VSLIRRAPDIRPDRRKDGPEPPAPRREAPYRCERGHEFTVTLAAEIEPPWTWDCRCGAPAHRLIDAVATAAADDITFADRSEHERHMEQLLQRRTAAELEEILADRLAELAAMRQTGRAAADRRSAISRCLYLRAVLNGVGQVPQQEREAVAQPQLTPQLTRHISQRYQVR